MHIKPIYIQSTYINNQPIHIIIQKIHHITPLTNTRQPHILFPPIFSLLIFSLKLSGIISKNGDELHYLTIDIFLVLIQSFINLRIIASISISAIPHPHFFVIFYYIYIEHHLKYHQNISTYSQQQRITGDIPIDILILKRFI
eukprot:75541_1